MSTNHLTEKTFSQWAEQDAELANALAAVQDLPAMANILSEFLCAIQDDDWESRQIAAIITRDPAITACILKVANSSLYSLQRQISNLEGAITVLGLATVKSLVMAASVKSMSRRFGLTEKLLLEDAIGGALCARAIARKTGRYDSEEAFLGGLFRHMGKIAMNNLDPDNYSRLIQAVYNGEGSLEALERKYFPFSHAAIGAALLDHWHFAPALVASTLYHSDLPPDDRIGPTAGTLARIVAVADHCCRRLGIGQRTAQPGLDIAGLAASRQLGLDADGIEDLIEETRDAFAQNRDSFLGSA
jgi:HD-like signal output (HDOD) protein